MTLLELKKLLDVDETFELLQRQHEFFFRSIQNGTNPIFSEDRRLEQEYEKLFKKIARDFVTREDLEVVLTDFVELLLKVMKSFEKDSKTIPLILKEKKKHYH